jgi:hypothetical protein
LDWGSKRRGRSLEGDNKSGPNNGTSLLYGVGGVECIGQAAYSSV